MSSCQLECDDRTGLFLDPKNEQVANLACCSFGDPETPILSAATICVFVGSDTEYFAGAEAQAQEIFEMARQNAASSQPVGGRGDDAYWNDTFGDLHVLQGNYEIEISIEAGGDDTILDASKVLAQKALQRLP